jgi:hypothetical protein
MQFSFYYVYIGKVRTVCFHYCRIIIIMNSYRAVVFQYLETECALWSAADASAAGVPYGLPLLISKIDWCHFYVNDVVE